MSMSKSLPNFKPSFDAVTEEIHWQNQVWGDRDPDAYSGGNAFDRSLDEYTLYILRYANKLAGANCLTPEDFDAKVHTLRKIAALSIAAMSEHGPLTRSQENSL